ncbi:hypothetical protein [Flavobacterium sp. TAB 87]|uniref:hypothetical protein n=1 Tax=Flavobacterium sp. TAB 87 TaxID=1729581 RepID=UPI00076DDCC5|nr:hypothetical protein [Flavobacterium sp. TAB 87]KVV16044.1 hypothetical protein AP058_00479 [Flavobacterium sp. TAB 87]
MREKDQEKINSDLKKVVNDHLLNGFKNRQHRLVDTVKEVRILNSEIIQDENDRDHILVKNIQVGARVFVIFGDDAKSSDNILVKNQGPLSFRYNKEIDNFELEEATAKFYDATN